jgi:hypothetical protein
METPHAMFFWALWPTAGTSGVASCGPNPTTHPTATVMDEDEDEGKEEELRQREAEARNRSLLPSIRTPGGRGLVNYDLRESGQIRRELLPEPVSHVLDGWILEAGHLVQVPVIE